MLPSTKKIIEYWRSNGLAIANGVSADELSRFEIKHDLRLPDDLRDYFLTVNGMVQNVKDESDKNLFAFWPINKLGPMPEICAADSCAVPDIVNPSSYFVFIDYFMWSWAYAIQLGESTNSVILVGTKSPTVVARSFAEFVDLYVADDRDVYEGPTRRAR